jgi:hypothetical protein
MVELEQVRELVIEALRYIGPAFAGAGITYFFTGRRYKKQEVYDFTKRRLNELYGPLCSRLGQLRASGKMKVAIFQAKDAAWKEKCERRSAPFLDHEEAFEPYAKSNDYENKHFRESVIPLYDEMLKILNEKRHLAFPSTLRFYDPFYRFVQLWHRWLDDAIPGEAIKKIEVPEEKLQPFYSEIETKHAALLRRLSGDRKHRRSP